MEMKYFNSIKNEYQSFNNRLEENISNYPTNSISEDCYLVEQSFIKELENFLISHNKMILASYYNQQYLSYNKIPFNIKQPTIINSFNMAINYIKNNKEIFLISKTLIKLIGFNYILKNNNNVLYYGGNGKLIIEYKNNKDNMSFLIINYNKQKTKNIFIIKKKKVKYIL